MYKLQARDAVHMAGPVSSPHGTLKDPVASVFEYILCPGFRTDPKLTAGCSYKPNACIPKRNVLGEE
jgi:hypothetical protein